MKLATRAKLKSVSKQFVDNLATRTHTHKHTHSLTVTRTAKTLFLAAHWRHLLPAYANSTYTHSLIPLCLACSHSCTLSHYVSLSLCYAHSHSAPRLLCSALSPATTDEIWRHHQIWFLFTHLLCAQLLAQFAPSGSAAAAVAAASSCAWLAALTQFTFQLPLACRHVRFGFGEFAVAPALSLSLSI